MHLVQSLPKKSIGFSANHMAFGGPVLTCILECTSCLGRKSQRGTSIPFSLSSAPCPQKNNAHKIFCCWLLPFFSFSFFLFEQGDQTDKVVYGAMEHGQPLRQNEKMSGLLREMGEKLMIAEREIDAVPIKKPLASSSTGTSSPAAPPTAGAGISAGSSDKEEDGVEEEEGSGAAAGTGEPEEGEKTVRITGSVEMKGIVGSDNRSYLLDVSRLTPRDANWVKGDKGTGVYEDWMAVRAAGGKGIIASFLLMCVFTCDFRFYFIFKPFSPRSRSRT